MLKKYLLPVLLGLFILGINTFRFIDLSGVPYGFQIDELASGVTLACLAENGSAPLGNTRYPLFGDRSFGSPTPPTYMYPGILWVKIFGSSEAAMRGYTAFATVVAIIGLIFIGNILKGWTCGLWIGLAASISPWMWTLSRIAWESVFAIPFLIWGLFFCLRPKRAWHLLLAGALLAGAAYSYPPTRMQVPLLLAVLSWYGIQRLGWRLPQVMTLIGTTVLVSIPLIHAMIVDPSLMERSKGIVITNPEYLSSIGKTASFQDIAPLITRKLFLHLHPDFLLFKGTFSDLTVSTGRQGIMSWLDILAVIAGILWLAKNILIRKPVPKNICFLLLLLGINIIIGCLPAALVSYDGPPGSLRAIGAWPFAMIATGLIIHRSATHWPRLWFTGLAVSTAFAVIFLTHYFRDYRKSSAGWFSAWTLEEARNAKTNEQWMAFLYRYHPHMFTSRYYLMRYGQKNCEDARQIWSNLYPLFNRMAQQQAGGQ